MKLQLIIMYLFAFLIFGCNSKSTENKEIKLLKKEKELLEKDSIPQENTQITNKENIETEETEPIDKNYLISDKSAGKFKVGSQIPFPETSDNYKLKKETQTRMTEEGPEEETIYVVSANSKDLLKINPEYSYETGNDSQNIGEIIILSEKFKTLNGIGVNSTIQDFINTYPKYNIWYTYVSGMYIIDTEEINAQFILNGKDFIGKLETTSDMTTLKKSDFNSNTKILKIRIY